MKNNNKVNDVVIQPGKKLYRYNLGKDIPSDWSSEYINPEYINPEYIYPNLGRKNQIGAFFFFNNITAAKNTLFQAIKNFKDKGVIYKKGIITSCSTKSPIRLLDLSKFDDCAKIIYFLCEQGINILSDNFISHQRKCSFIELKKDFELLSDNNPTIRLAGINKINDFFYYRPHILCQTLTDFDNGKYFKAMLEEKGYEGYIFKENPDSNTFCLFSSDKLTQPRHTKIEV